MASQDRSATSVILPTLEWGPVCEQLASQLGPADELLVVCDSADDPLADVEPPENVRILVAGEPDGCSGKANAVACGMRHAENDRFVWTDDDFDRDPDWLSSLVEHGENHGPATVIPLFTGDGWWAPYEPLVTLTSSFSFYAGVGPWGGNAWGGGVTFTRSDVDVDALVADLERSLSDDGLLSAYLDDVYPVRSMTAVVELPGTFHSVKERLIRYIRLTHVHEGAWPALGGFLALTCLAVLFPILVASSLTLLLAGVYFLLGFYRWTFLLGFPALFLAVPTAAAGIFSKEFDWGGRRYRLHGPCDVEVIGPSRSEE